MMSGRKRNEQARAICQHPRQAGADRAPKGRRKDPGEDANPRNKGRSNGKSVQGISKNRKKEVVMPLIKDIGKKAFQKNVKAELAAGKPVKQAVAIAYAVKREAATKKKKK